MNMALSALATAISPVAPAPAPLVYLHVALFLADGRVLSDETFRLVNLQGQESISQNFEFELELHGNTSPAHGAAIAFNDVVGQPVTVGLHCPALDDGGQQPSREEANAWFQAALNGSDESQRLRFFNGVAASFSMEQPGVYRLTLRPALWKLTLTNAYRIHPHMTVRDAIEAVLKQHRIRYAVDALSGNDNLAVTRRQDWLQAGESDFDFLCRLLAKAHIYWFFIHTAKNHTVVFANRPAYPQAVPGGRPLRYCSTDESELGLAQADTISDYRVQQNLASSAVNAVFTREEAAWEHDTVAWEQDTVASFHSYSASANSRVKPGNLPFAQYLIYQYGCSWGEVNHFAHNTQDALDTASREFSGTSACPWLCSGHSFSTTQFPRADQWPDPVRPQLEGTSWVLTQVEHQASLDGSYSNKFRAVDAAGLATPFSMQETQQGAVLAKVVAPNGSSATPPSNWRYYEKTNFDPEPRSDAVADTDAAPSAGLAQGVCVRFSNESDDAEPHWVKLAAHMQTIPEIGVTVLVARAQDQSELPEIQSIVQANGSMTITPSRWTANTNVGSNYSTAYGDAQNIHFGLHSEADLNRAIGIVRDQYASGQFRDTAYSQGASYSYATSEDGANGLLSKSDSYGSAYSTHHGARNSSRTVFDNTDSDSLVTGTAKNVNTVDGVSDNTSTQAVVISDSSTGMSTSVEKMGIHAGLSATVMSSTASSTGVRMQASMEGMSVNASMTGVSSSHSLTGMSEQTNATGASTSTNVTGASTHTAMTGVETGVNLTGVSSTTSLTGASTSTSLVGAHIETNVIGASTRMSVTGESTSISVLGTSTDISLSGETTTLAIKGPSMSLDAPGLSLQMSPGYLHIQAGGMDLTVEVLKIFV